VLAGHKLRILMNEELGRAIAYLSREST